MEHRNTAENVGLKFDGTRDASDGKWETVQQPIAVTELLKEHHAAIDPVYFA